jgi:hypothetical protein
MRPTQENSAEHQRENIVQAHTAHAVPRTFEALDRRPAQSLYHLGLYVELKPEYKQDNTAKAPRTPRNQREKNVTHHSEDPRVVNQPSVECAPTSFGSCLTRF